MEYSAQGTRLNRRGLETRRRFLAAAVDRLAAGGPDAASANRIAQDAGLTWGTIQHQFGDVDGVWAAVLQHCLVQAESLFEQALPGRAAPRERVAAIVDTLLRTYDSPVAQAVQNLRLALPRDRGTLERLFPATVAALRRADATWTRLWESLFEGMDVAPERLRRARRFVPGAVRGLYDQSRLTTFTDLDDAREGLIDAITVYLD
ncbi:TetR/AcrR family transcriptional regulator [Actinomadura sp. 21ATH]|uniref:TetR/AcrR family transcriptional regulator n=1 Tax=Actinomadura sp. 21ATH TaxID=1735444 RepID=UPI0035C02D5B